MHKKAAPFEPIQTLAPLVSAASTRFARFLSGLALSLLLLFAVVPASSAEDKQPDKSPDQALNEYLKKVQKDGSMLAIVDDVDWDTAYTLFPAERHNSIINVDKIDSADDVRNYFVEIFGDQKVRVEKMRDRMLKDAKEHGGDISGIDQNVQAMQSAFDRFQLNIQLMIKMSSFKTGAVRLQDPRAYVELQTTRQGITTTKEVAMVRKEGRWLLAEPALITMKGQKIVAPGGAKPSGPIGPSPFAGPVVGQ